MLGYVTEGWDCGTDECKVELDTKSKDLTEENMAAIENECNYKIQQGVKVYAAEYQPGDPMLKMAHTRGLPKDHVGSIRIVSIDGIDHNMCCGTHVSNLNQLQLIKLLKTSKGQRGKKYFYLVPTR